MQSQGETEATGPAYAKIIDSDLVELHGNALLRLKFAMISADGIFTHWADLPVRHKNADAERMGRSSLATLAHAMGMDIHELGDSEQLHGKLVALYRSPRRRRAIEVRRVTCDERIAFKRSEGKLKALLRTNGELPKRGSRLPTRLRKFLPDDAGDLFA